MIELKHYIRYPVKNKGYTARPNAQSNGIDVDLYLTYYGGRTNVPIRYTYTKEDYRGYLLLNISDEECLFSQIYPVIPRDDGRGYRKRGVGYHTVIVKRSYLKERQLSLPNIKIAMEEFRNSYAEELLDKKCRERCEIPDLKIEESDDETFVFYNEEMSRYITKIAYKKLIYQLNRGKKVMLSKQNIMLPTPLSGDEKLILGTILHETIDLEMDLRKISFFTEHPLGQYKQILLDRFDVALCKPFKIPQLETQTWVAINRLDIEEPSFKLDPQTMSKVDEIYGRLDLEVINNNLCINNPILKVNTPRKIDNITLKIGKNKVKGERDNQAENQWNFDLVNLSLEAEKKYNAKLQYKYIIKEISFMITGNKKITMKHIASESDGFGKTSPSNKNDESMHDKSIKKGDLTKSKESNTVKTKSIMKPTYDIKDLAKKQIDR